MKHLWMNAVAVAALTAGIAAANAQSASEQKQDREPQAQSQSPSGGTEQPSARPEKQERSGAQERGGQAQTGSDAKSGAGEAPKAEAAQKDEKDDASRTTQSEPKGSKQDRQTQTQDRDSDKRGERAGSTERKDGGTAQTRDRDNKRAGQRDRDDDRANRQDRDRDERRAGDRDRDRDRAGDRDRDRTAGDRQDRQGGDRVQFSERERTTFRDTISRENVERTNVNINVSIGATVPRNITLRPLPASIIEINPAYRSYRYVVVRDEIVIINPQTYHVVEVVPLSGGSAVRAGRGSNRASVQLSSQQRRRILTYAQAECDTVLATPEFQISVGTRIPERIELCPFEDVLVREVDVVRPYRFFVVKDEVVLVDPSDHTIVEVIR